MSEKNKHLRLQGDCALENHLEDFFPEVCVDRFAQRHASLMHLENIYAPLTAEYGEMS